ncbi:KpsF/GutQ family sugar-phosphate isomerase [Sphingomonas sp. LY29]|uniref:KpsF/GutQ family sugar-phosphate isomerase n=1 Tax=Sphingomonas sp. LY29 TaxID=3095341 RepID=UPI002D7995F6|nr:KpsF/GutQ family sugar-phosphate isomerase [Sphingomonas sp. LY29]WRP25326.1 KpsF/GutQ family sugar-phosphate isomerase [Sphingomonas sp. LY29]
MTVQASVRRPPLNEMMLRRGAEVIAVEAEALQALAQSLDGTFVDACNTILSSTGRVVVTGMGKSGHIGRKWAATMAATGTPAIYVHPAEAAHGDLGMLIPGDVLIVISNSGNTSELRAFLSYAVSIGVKIIGVASRMESLVMQNADVRLLYPEAREACTVNIAPTTSTTMQLALGDAMALALMDSRGFSLDRMKVLHPGGSLGLRMTPVREVMHGPARMPLVDQATSMRDVILTMTSTGFGMAGVVDMAGRLVGVITDGDIRRHFDDLATAKAAEVMTADPITLCNDTIAEDALHLLNQNKITGAFVMDRRASVNANVPIGFVHIHDFLRIGLS